MYIDDTLLAATFYLNRDCVQLLPTAGPHGRLSSCGLGVPGGWFPLQHRLRDVEANAKSIGMELNSKKTTLMMINESKNRLCVPYCALEDGDPLPVVDNMRLLGLVIDDRLSWWPLVHVVTKKAKAKIWSLLKLREAGASSKQLLDLYLARVRSTLRVWGPWVWTSVKWVTVK